MTGSGNLYRLRILQVGVEVLRPKHPGIAVHNILSTPAYRSALKAMLEESYARSTVKDGDMLNLIAEIKRMEGLSTS